MNRTHFMLLLAVGALATGCVSVKTVDEDQIPAAWRQAMATKATTTPNLAGRYAPAGQVVRSDGKVDNWTLTELFFPGKYLRRHQPRLDAGELRLDAGGNLIFTGWKGDEVVLTGTFETVFQPETGAVLVKSIPVSDANNKFGAVASTRSARLYLGADHALYAQVRQSGAGVMLVMPVAGTFSEWARWDVAAP